MSLLDLLSTVDLIRRVSDPVSSQLDTNYKIVSSAAALTLPSASKGPSNRRTMPRN